MNTITETPKSTPRDFFMYLLSTVSLYLSVAAIITLLFQYVNAAFPDAVNPDYGLAGTVRWFVSMLLIVFPVYYWTARTLRKERDAEPARSELKVRKWLLYLTLFLAAALIIGDMVALVYNFLEGELSIRFYLKVAAILLVAGSVFSYYLYDLRRTPGEPRSAQATWLIRLAVAAVLATIIGGFFVVGSPFRQRAIRFDRQKLSDLQNLENSIQQYWAAKEALPEDLEDLGVLGWQPPVRDPETKELYEYRRTGDLSYELCAEFNLSSADAAQYEYAPEYSRPYPGYGSPADWSYEPGQKCFDREIDPDIINQRYPKPMSAAPARPI